MEAANELPNREAAALLSVRNLNVSFPTREGVFHAVQNVSFEVGAGERVAIVGESGSGKSMTTRSLLRLVPAPGKLKADAIEFAGKDVLRAGAARVTDLRGGDIAIVHQDPMSSWNPVRTVGAQIKEAMLLHRRIPRSDVVARCLDLLKRVGVSPPEKRASSYPHEFSGGMRQRCMIGMGLANRPRLLIADEPTTALDVTVQDQIIRLLRDVNAQDGTALLLISHNLALVASLCDRIIVMYAGRIVEEGPAEQIYKSPQHPYTWGLLRSVPKLDAPRDQPMYGIPGHPPEPSSQPTGCRFKTRCAFRQARCDQEEPELIPVGGQHRARCWVTMRVANQTNDEVAGG